MTTETVKDSSQRSESEKSDWGKYLANIIYVAGILFVLGFFWQSVAYFLFPG
jgi:hypothetical protein